MANTEILGVQRNVYNAFASEGNPRAVGVSPDGATYTMDWPTRLALGGRVYTAHIGAAATPVSFAKTAYDADQPQFVLDVPNGTIAVPLRIDLTLQDSAGTDTIVTALFSNLNVGAGTSTAVTPVNHRASGADAASSVYTLYTGNGTDPTTGTEMWFWTDVYAFADTTVGPIKTFTWENTYQPLTIEGAGSMVIYVVATTTAPAGYLRVTWAELAEAAYPL